MWLKIFLLKVFVLKTLEDFVPLELLLPTKLKLMLGLMCSYSQGCNEDEQKEFEGDIFCAVFIWYQSQTSCSAGCLRTRKKQSSQLL